MAVRTRRFSVDEDISIVEFVYERVQQGDSVIDSACGNALWLLAVQTNVTQRSMQSLRDHWRRVLRNETFLKTLPIPAKIINRLQKVPGLLKTPNQNSVDSFNSGSDHTNNTNGTNPHKSSSENEDSDSEIDRPTTSKPKSRKRKAAPIDKTKRKLAAAGGRTIVNYDDDDSDENERDGEHQALINERHQHRRVSQMLTQATVMRRDSQENLDDDEPIADWSVFNVEHSNQWKLFVMTAYRDAFPHKPAQMTIRAYLDKALVWYRACEKAGDCTLFSYRSLIVVILQLPRSSPEQLQEHAKRMLEQLSIEK